MWQLRKNNKRRRKKRIHGGVYILRGVSRDRKMGLEGREMKKMQGSSWKTREASRRERNQLLSCRNEGLDPLAKDSEVEWPANEVGVCHWSLVYVDCSLAYNGLMSLPPLKVSSTENPLGATLTPLLNPTHADMLRTLASACA